MRALGMTSWRRVAQSAGPARPPLSTSPTLELLRFFTRNAPGSFVNPTVPRPQLPFLYPPLRPKARRAVRRRMGSWQVARGLSTEQKFYLKDQARIGAKFILFTGTLGALVVVLVFGINEERRERIYPTPPEWSIISRSSLRTARASEEPEANDDGVVDWVFTGVLYRNLLKRLEDPNLDGAGLRRQDGDEGEQMMGYDIEAKSYPWRRGYYETLIGAAKGAENLDGFLRDDTRMIVFPPDVVLGPSNPNPRPSPPNFHAPPLEKDCSPATLPAHTYYKKILTTKGFTTQERLLAALAYADWLDFKDLSDEATKMYRQALEIATSTIDRPESVVDLSTGIITPDAPLISSNVLLAATSLAVHHARRAELSAALPIFVSVLRARRSLPAPPPSMLKPSRIPDDQDGVISSLVSAIRPLFFPAPYPDLPPSGDDQAFRTPASICEEGGVMAHIGEILFASSSFRDGLKWTREAVDVAEAIYENSQRDEEATEKCGECLQMGMENWQKMVARLARADADAALLTTKTPPPAASSSWWRPVAWQKANTDDDGPTDWEQERLAVEGRARKIESLLQQERFHRRSATWFGSMLFT